LLLDEPTSALDAGSEHLVEEAIRQGAAGRTTLIVAHRLSTVRNVDRLVFLDNGEIKEFGTHDELLALGGSYAGLVSKSQRIGRDQSVHATEGVV
jgi:ABC-type multidrug transport system fused ATPase/permease subunit